MTTDKTYQLLDLLKASSVVYLEDQVVATVTTIKGIASSSLKFDLENMTTVYADLHQEVNLDEESYGIIVTQTYGPTRMGFFKAAKITQHDIANPPPPGHSVFVPTP